MGRKRSGAGHEFDVLIVGGGMVGASLACALGGQSLRIAVVEPVPFSAASQPSYDDRSIALAWGTRRVFEAIGIWEGLATVVTPIEEIHVSDYGHFGAARMKAATIGFDALGYVVENRELGRLFSGLLPGLPNVDLICPGRVQSIGIEPGGARAGIDCAGEMRDLSARLVVGADGGQSAVRRLCGIGAKTVDYGQNAVIANVTPEQPHRNRAWERFTEHGPLALLPMSANRCSLVWTIPRAHSDGMLALPDAEFLAALQARFGYRLGRFERTGARASYPLIRVSAARHVAERLALIGNAAHTLHPVAGQGFNLGLRDVAVLAEVIADAHAAGEDIGGTDVLARYQRWRAADQQRVLTLTDGLVRVFSNDFTPLVIARNAGMVALDLLPPLKRLMMRQTMGLAGPLPRLARGLPL
jgi:2-octaprenyl-6-methoxyphenol hydroxylase